MALVRSLTRPWLSVANGSCRKILRASATSGFELRTSAFARLRAREMQRVGLEAAARLRASLHPVEIGERVQGRAGEIIQASGGKIVIIERRDGLSAVPWPRGLENLRGREVSGIVSARGLVVGRMRGLQR